MRPGKYIRSAALKVSHSPVPFRFRRQMIALGNGYPSRAICSSLIAGSFQSIQYPILPSIERKTELAKYQNSEKVNYHIHHFSLFTTRGFDMSSFFRIVKPTYRAGLRLSVPGPQRSCGHRNCCRRRVNATTLVCFFRCAPGVARVILALGSPHRSRVYCSPGRKGPR